MKEDKLLKILISRASLPRKEKNALLRVDKGTMLWFNKFEVFVPCKYLKIQ
jgi:hypothetical protein